MHKFMNDIDFIILGLYNSVGLSGLNWNLCA